MKTECNLTCPTKVDFENTVLGEVCKSHSEKCCIIHFNKTPKQSKQETESRTGGGVTKEAGG